MKPETAATRQKGYAFIKAVARQVYLLLYAVGMTAALVITTVVLVVFYYTLFTATALVGRLFGQKFLDTSFRKHTVSYWISKGSIMRSEREWERQF
jgi:hypothetical protein